MIGLFLEMLPRLRAVVDQECNTSVPIAVFQKSATGNVRTDACTNLDYSIQTALLNEFIDTLLIECEVNAEEESELTRLFRKANGYSVNIDPLNRSLALAQGSVFFNTILQLHGPEGILVTWVYFPRFAWEAKIISGVAQAYRRTRYEEQEIIRGKDSIPLKKPPAVLGVRPIVYDRHPLETDPELYQQLLDEGYTFVQREHIQEIGSLTALLWSYAGLWVDDPNIYDGLVAYHLGMVRSDAYIVYRCHDAVFTLDRVVTTENGSYIPGSYVVVPR